MTTQKKILFICLGNICRSPIAESVMKSLVNEAGLNDKIHIDSAGLINNHEGEAADPRALRCLTKNGLDAPSRSRPITSNDIQNYDYLVAMDSDNLVRLKGPIAGHEHKLTLLLDWTDDRKGEPIPDPYYGHDSGFDEVLLLCQIGCEGLLAHLQSELD